MSKILEIAGTSIGGSSYTDRIMRMATQYSSEPIILLIKQGAYQEQVFKKVKQKVELLNNFIERRGGGPVLWLQVKKEEE